MRNPTRLTDLVFNSSLDSLMRGMKPCKNSALFPIYVGLNSHDFVGNYRKHLLFRNNHYYFGSYHKHLWSCNCHYYFGSYHKHLWSHNHSCIDRREPCPKQELRQQRLSVRFM